MYDKILRFPIPLKSNKSDQGNPKNTRFACKITLSIDYSKLKIQLGKGKDKLYITNTKHTWIQPHFCMHVKGQKLFDDQFK